MGYILQKFLTYRVVTQGKTVEQAMERVREAIQVCLEAEELEDVTGGAIGRF